MKVYGKLWAVMLCAVMVLMGCGAEPLPEEATESFLETRLYAILPDPASFFGAEADSVAEAGENGRMATFRVTAAEARAYAELLQQPDLKLYLHEQYSFIGTEKEDEFWFFDYVGESGFTPFTTSYEPAGEQPFSDAVCLHLCERAEETTLTIICSEDMAVIDLGHRVH